MPRRVRANGVIHNFPDDATDAEISAALGAIPEDNAKAAPKARTWAEQLGLTHQPSATTESKPMAFLKGAGGAAVDMAEGAKANLVGSVFEGGDLIRRATGMERVIDRPEVQASMTAPETVAGKVGEYAAPVAGAAGLVKAGISALPNAARAAKGFQEVMGAARNVAVDLSQPGNVALRIQQLADRGASMPMAVRKFLNRATDPNKAGMVYEEARDWASNFSRLSRAEFQRLSPSVAREVAELRVQMNAAVGQAAKQAGKMDEYNAAMKEYAQAMRLKEAIDKSLRAVKKAALPVGALGGGAYWFNREIGSMFGRD